MNNALNHDAESAYAADVAAKPSYHDGTPRPDWQNLSEIAKYSWRKNPTPRFCKIAIILSI